MFLTSQTSSMNLERMSVRHPVKQQIEERKPHKQMSIYWKRLKHSILPLTSQLPSQNILKERMVLKNGIKRLSPRRPSDQKTRGEKKMMIMMMSLEVKRKERSYQITKNICIKYNRDQAIHSISWILFIEVKKYFVSWSRKQLVNTMITLVKHDCQCHLQHHQQEDREQHLDELRVVDV